MRELSGLCYFSYSHLGGIDTLKFIIMMNVVIYSIVKNTPFALSFLSSNQRAALNKL